MKKKTGMAVAVLLVATVLTGCKHNKGDVLDGPDMLRIPVNSPAAESVDSQRTAAAIEGQSDDVQADGVTAAPESDWTEEAVESQVLKYFDAVNKTFAEGSEKNPFDLDRNFNSAYWNEIYSAVNEKESNVRSVEERFFVDDNHWTAGMETPLEVKDIKVELLTGDMAEAEFTLLDKRHGQRQKAILSLDYERGQWRISNWLGENHDISSSILVRMEKYVGR